MDIQPIDSYPVTRVVATELPVSISTIAPKMSESLG